MWSLLRGDKAGHHLCFRKTNWINFIALKLSCWPDSTLTSDRSAKDAFLHNGEDELCLPGAGPPSDDDASVGWEM